MAQTQVYTLEQFLADTRLAFASSKDPKVIASDVAAHLRRLLAVPGWLEERLNLPAQGGFGTYCVHQDTEYGHPQPGFTMLAHVNPVSRGSGAGGTGRPHDHGPCFVVYGMYQGSMVQRKYRWEGGDTKDYSQQVQEYARFPQAEKEVAFFLPGEIHAPLNTTEGERSIIIRLTSQDLAQVWRHRYDLQSGQVELIRTAD